MIEELLTSHGVPFQRHDHPPVRTCEEAARLASDVPGAGTKNLFLRDGKGSRYFLLVTRAETEVDLRALGAALEVKGLGLASPERLRAALAVEPGAVTPLALVNDGIGAVSLLWDRSLDDEERIQCHPLVNTATLVVPTGELRRFLAETGHSARVIVVPVRSSPAP